MKLRYQINEVRDAENHAGPKALQDVVDIASNFHFQKFDIIIDKERHRFIDKCVRQLLYIKDWISIYLRTERNSVVLLQHPFHHRQLPRKVVLYLLKKVKKVRYISLVHDVEELRQALYRPYYRKEFETMLAIADTIIVHNDRMKDFFIRKGYPKDQLISLGIFDYLQEKEATLDKVITFNKSLVIAGNLDIEKAAYIRELSELKDIKLNLYGPNFDESLSNQPNLFYGGSLPSEDVPAKLVSGFGLVWDGDRLDRCSGPYGEYLKYNNPHKLSLYLSSGLPVVIWKEAAEADFVEKNGVGFVVNDLREVEELFHNLTETDYNKMVSNVSTVRKRLLSGYYTENALKQALVLLKE